MARSGAGLPSASARVMNSATESVRPGAADDARWRAAATASLGVPARPTGVQQRLPACREGGMHHGEELLLVGHRLRRFRTGSRRTTAESTFGGGRRSGATRWSPVAPRRGTARRPTSRLLAAAGASHEALRHLLLHHQHQALEEAFVLQQQPKQRRGDLVGDVCYHRARRAAVLGQQCRRSSFSTSP